MLASLHPSHTRRVPKMTFWTRRRVVAAACCPCSARSAGRETTSRSAWAIASFRAVWRKFIRDSSTGAVRSPPETDRAYPARSRDRRHRRPDGPPGRRGPAGRARSRGAAGRRLSQLLPKRQRHWRGRRVRRRDRGDRQGRGRREAGAGALPGRRPQNGRSGGSLPVAGSRGGGPCSSSSASATSPWTPRACYRTYTRISTPCRRC
jgi:hypothetical protein